MEHNYRFFCNRDCEYFPCHTGADLEQFNCLFCYCPLYPLGSDCGGQFTYTDDGVKDCSTCLLPHDPRRYDHILSKWPDLCALMNINRTQKPE